MALFDMQHDARYIGRLDWSDPSGPVLSWAGSAIAVRFEGAAITLKMIVKERNDTWVDLIVDGGPPRKLHIDGASGEFPVAAGLGPGPHTAQVYKRTEAMFGTVQFLGFDLPEGGEFLPPPPHLERKIEIIGDSVSCGSGNEGKDGDPNIAEHENSSRAYGTLAAQAVDAEHHTIAVSGIGLVANYRDERVNTMSDQFDRLNPLDPQVKWDFSEWIPDIVAINLGTNDSGYAVDESEFVEKYRRFVAHIRSQYPDAHIFMSLGPYQQAPMKDYIYKACEEIRAAGDANVHYLLFDRVNVERDGLGETGHPNVITHAHMAEQLTQEIKAKTGW